jgi:hypothetical protein
VRNPDNGAGLELVTARLGVYDGDSKLGEINCRHGEGGRESETQALPPARLSVPIGPGQRERGSGRCAHHVEVDTTVDAVYSRVAMQLPDEPSFDVRAKKEATEPQRAI